MRKFIYEIIEPRGSGCRLSQFYDLFMIATIITSIIPLAFKKPNILFFYIDYVCVSIFVIDYILRLITADFKLKKSIGSFFIYPFTPMAIIDLLSILPTLKILHSGLKLLKLFRLMRAFKVLRTFKFLRYSKSFDIIANIFKKQKDVLSAVGSLAVAYVLVCALIIYNVEPDSFNTFFDAIYWAVESLTTVGYGDIYPVTYVGKIVTMISSMFGIAIIALPASVITAGYMAEISNADNDDEQ